MDNCPYLIYEPSHCAACTGWFCIAFGREKRLSDTSMCVDEEEWIECTRYIQKVPPVKEPEPEEEVVELPLTEEVTSITGVDMETIEISVEPEPVEVEVPPPTPSTDCPYFAPDPPGATCCSGFHCRAINAPLRAYKICKSRPSWRECRRFLKAVRQGVK